MEDTIYLKISQSSPYTKDDTKMSASPQVTMSDVLSDSRQLCTPSLPSVQLVATTVVDAISDSPILDKGW